MADREPIYLDYNATTPVDPRVLEVMLPYFGERFGNAASRHHRAGREAAEAVERARRQVANLIGADPREIVWVSGATEADNLAIKGVAASPVATARGKHIVTVATEHRAVLDPCERLEGRGYPVTYLGVDGAGRLDLDELAGAITEQTFLVSVMHANNETGVIHPIGEIGAICRDKRALFHTDATQSAGKEPIDVEQMKIDLLSLSAHKLYGPKGVGALFIRRRRPRVRCEPLLDGGGHERGVRSGTLNVPGIVGLGAAVEICGEEMAVEQVRIRALRDRLEARVLATVPEARVFSREAPRLANTSSLSFPGLDAEALIEAMPRIAISTASACTSAARQASYVLAALGATPEEVAGSIRISLGRFTRDADVDAATEQIVQASIALTT
jgi:cysteine desulfurase